MNIVDLSWCFVETTHFQFRLELPSKIKHALKDCPSNCGEVEDEKEIVVGDIATVTVQLMWGSAKSRWDRIDRGGFTSYIDL